ncbi:restriction endonuclease subunit S [Leptospira vanthielii]|uniref:Type I restriction modification DNA specificity domain protein n=1 Tax=Leptospira vanthielii serovar Holland str. Waz Holland = ATCC 700522 TaxID=1218591 RepID=N1W9A0_9LEPT|nr:restriction endonuclease subunit S [Leptospira vanthielii]EMY71558.1 type I restriction modification DNA specificity domain protein [Leptospira vanthielii serovar Holland str. Waz Holland = ATCC 700522]
MSEWKEFKLGDIADKIGDGLHGTPAYSDDGEYYFINGNNLLNGKISIKNETKKVTEAEYQKHKKPLSNRTILLGINGTIGNLAFYNGEKCVLGKSACYINISSDIDNFFIYYKMLSKEFQSTLLEIATGTTIINVPLKGLREIPILLPTIAEQKDIAGVLSALDEKIDLLHRQNKTLEAMAEALFRQWFVEEAEESWEEGKLGDEFIITMGQSPPGESYNEDGVGIPMYQGNADFEFRFPKNRVFTTDPKRFAEKYDTLISVRAPVGAQNMANEECCIGRGVASLRYKIKSDLYSYTYYKIRYHMLEIAGFNDTGTVFGSIGKEDLWGIKTQIPSTLESEEIDLRLKPLNDRIIENCFQIRSLEKLRDTLLPKLMSGEVKVDINRDI